MEKEEVEKALELPPMSTRQCLNARDPISAVQRFDIATHVLLGRILGTRMCLRCPDCNTIEAEEQAYGCQNRFGNNAMALGGSAGYCEHVGGMKEFQGDGTPHLHGTFVVSSVYQFATLQEIADLIEKDMLSVEAIKEYQMRLCREEHYQHEEHKTAEVELERGWNTNYAEPEHQALCAMPAFFSEETSATLWDVEASKDDKEVALAEGQKFKERFENHVQFVFSRAQHHWHRWENGKRVPLKYCLGGRGQRKRGVRKCRGKFPKTQQCTVRAKVVCPGVAAQHGLRISGRQNALGTILSRRRCEWLSGTMALFSLRCSNQTHTHTHGTELPHTTECEVPRP